MGAFKSLVRVEARMSGGFINIFFCIHFELEKSEWRPNHRIACLCLPGSLANDTK